MSKRQYRCSTCFVPNCTTGYKSSKTKVSVFRVPKDPERLSEWERNIKRGDKKLTSNCVVCALHFDERYIERSFRHIINGEVVEIPRDIPKLTDDAIPTCFPGAPAYINKKVPIKRKKRNLCDQVAPKKKRTENLENEDVDSAIIQYENGSSLLSPELQLYKELELPNSSWVRIIAQEFPTAIHYCCCKFKQNDYSMLNVGKLLKIEQESDGSILCSTFIRGLTESSQKIISPDEAFLLLVRANSLTPCSGCDIQPVGRVEFDSFDGTFFSKKCTLCTADKICLHCKYLKKLAVKQKNRKKLTSAKRKTQLRRRHYAAKKARNLKQALDLKKQTIREMKLANECLSKQVIEEQFKKLPPKQRLMVKTCFQAAQRKSTKGMSYQKEWILECILMRMRSPKLYNHLRSQQLLVLPSNSCLQKYLREYQSGFGFNPSLFSALSIKTKDMDIFARHGGLLFDELKLSEHLTVHADGTIDGFVNLGQFTSDTDKMELCNHGFVVMFQPFQGQWTQILGVFASKMNVKANILSKIIIEAIILAENSGLFVDFVTCDGASWNRSMWTKFGIKGSLGDISFKSKHPVSNERELHFLSDFPHLIKCLRNALVKHGFQTPDGHVRIEHIEEAWKKDNSSVTLKVMPRITKSHLRPNSFEKMRVNLAFQLFSEEVLKGIFLYKEALDAMYGSTDGTEKFIKLLEKLIYIMTSRIPSKALYPESKNTTFIEEFLTYLDSWETFAVENGGGFVSASTASGLRVTLKSTLSLIEYLATKLGYRYLLTANLSQDKLENLFGIIRQSSGTNDHPTPEQFLLTINCLSFYNLAKPPKHGNCSPELLDALLVRPDAQIPKGERLSTAIDQLLDFGSIDEAEFLMQRNYETLDHAGYNEQKSDSRLIYYIAGYVARKHLKKHPCLDCKAVLTDLSTQCDSNVDATLTKKFDHGGLQYPSQSLMALIVNLENSFTVYFSSERLNADSMTDYLNYLDMFCKRSFVGCNNHKNMVTSNIMKFFILVRFHFYTKALNKDRSNLREKQKFLKLRRCK